MQYRRISNLIEQDAKQTWYKNLTTSLMQGFRKSFKLLKRQERKKNHSELLAKTRLLVCYITFFIISNAHYNDKKQSKELF